VSQGDFVGRWEDRTGFVELCIGARGNGFLIVFPKGGESWGFSAGIVNWESTDARMSFSGGIGRGTGVLSADRNAISVDIAGGTYNVTRLVLGRVRSGARMTWKTGEDGQKPPLGESKRKKRGGYFVFTTAVGRTASRQEALDSVKSIAERIGGEPEGIVIKGAMEYRQDRK